MNLERPLSAGTRDLDEADPRPQIPVAREGVPGILIAGVAGVAALALFFALNNARVQRISAVPATSLAISPDVSSPPPLVVPRADVAPPAVFYPYVPSRLQPAPLINRSPAPVYYRTPQPTANPRPIYAPVPQSFAPPVPPGTPGDGVAVAPQLLLHSPSIVLDSGNGRDWTAVRANAPAAAAGDLSQAEKAARIEPHSLGDLSAIIAGGTLIQATLETALDTSRPGPARAIVGKDVRSFDGSHVLIPRGSHLIGELGGDTQSGHRVMVSWKQLLLPQGWTLDIESPSTDAGGQAGIAGVSHGGVGRFLGGLVQTAIGVGANLASTRGSVVVYGAPAAASTVQLFPQRGSSAPRITVNSGAKINVMVARTLDFSSTLDGRR